MEPLFKNITIYNSENYNQFIKFHGDKFNFSYNMYTFVLVFVMLYGVILGIIQKNILFVLLFLTILVLTVIFRTYIPMKRYEKTNQKYEENTQTSFTISFYKFYFTVDKKNFSYFKLYKVFETEEYFYLYIDKENAVLVSKYGFKIGTSEDFTDFIKKKCLFKYKHEASTL